MSGVEFHLGHNDHKVVEDFLARAPEGVGAITLPAKSARHAQGAAEAASARGAQVYFDPATERLTTPGYQMPTMPYATEGLYDINVLAADAPARSQLIGGVIEAHPSYVTAITPPHFFVTDERSASLNVALADDTRARVDRPLHAILFLARDYGVRHADELAAEYAHIGVRQLELRLSPFGGEDESLAKIRSGFKILDTFRAAGIVTTLGWSGNIGQVAVSLGHADSYSVGIGSRERVSLATALSTQRREYLKAQSDPSAKPKHVGGTGVYLPGIAQTVSSKIAERLLAHTDIRLRLSCRREECADAINGPTRDPRRHYLHARTGEMNDLLRQPARAWRANAEHQRLDSALKLRARINAKYIGDEHPLKVRTLQSILAAAATEETAQSA